MAIIYIDVQLSIFCLQRCTELSREHYVIDKILILFFSFNIMVLIQILKLDKLVLLSLIKGNENLAWVYFQEHCKL